VGSTAASMTLGTVRHLPSADRAIVEERKIREYLLNLAHTDGGAIARSFMARGFTVDAWDVLQASLIIQDQTNAATRIVDTEWGPRYTVECNCPTPDELNPCIRTVWQMEDGAPRLLTAIPAAGDYSPARAQAAAHRLYNAAISTIL
jgi:hypothetical protein